MATDISCDIRRVTPTLVADPTFFISLRRGGEGRRKECGFHRPLPSTTTLMGPLHSKRRMWHLDRTLSLTLPTDNGPNLDSVCENDNKTSIAAGEFKLH